MGKISGLSREITSYGREMSVITKVENDNRYYNDKLDQEQREFRKSKFTNILPKLIAKNPESYIGSEAEKDIKWGWTGGMFYIKGDKTLRLFETQNLASSIETNEEYEKRISLLAEAKNIEFSEKESFKKDFVASKSKFLISLDVFGGIKAKICDGLKSISEKRQKLFQYVSLTKEQYEELKNKEGTELSDYLEENCPRDFKFLQMRIAKIIFGIDEEHETLTSLNDVMVVLKVASRNILETLDDSIKTKVKYLKKLIISKRNKLEKVIESDNDKLALE